MINREATFRWKGYYPEELSKNSGRKVWRVCDSCGKGKWITFGVCTNLCHACAMNQPDIIEKKRKVANKQWAIPGAREARSDFMKQAFVNGDERFKKQGKSLKKFYIDNPDKLIEMSERNKIIFNTPERQKESHDRILKWRENNPEEYKKSLETGIITRQSPECRENARINRLGAKHTPETIDKMSKANIKRYEDPKEREKTSEANIKRYEDPKEHEKISKAMKKHYAEMDNPGKEIINHHYVYDHRDLSKYTIKITRAGHTRLHWKMRKVGYKIPHIHIKESI